MTRLGRLFSSEQQVLLYTSLTLCVCSPFEVLISEDAGPQKVRAWGPGLETGMVGKSADFVVEAIGTEVGTLGKACFAFLVFCIPLTQSEVWRTGFVRN